MDIFRNYTFTWWQVGLFKLALLSLGVAIGAYCQATFAPYITLLAVLGLGLGAYIAWVSFKQQ
jgi:disulfide bond formation protein DsbB